MSLKDEVIEVGQRLLVTLLTEPLKTGTVEQVHNWLQKGGRCLLLCTQSSSQLIDFVAAGLRGRLNCEVVDLFDTPELSGQAMQVRMPKGFTSAYRHLHLLLIPKGVKQGAPPQVPEQPHLPDAD
jgi:hypothetical protein